MNGSRTLADKLWAAHEIARREDGATLLWVDRHYVHEGSFHAFDQMKARGRTIAEPTLTFGVADHYVPTRGRGHAIANPEIAAMVRNLENNAARLCQIASRSREAAHARDKGEEMPRESYRHRAARLRADTDLLTLGSSLYSENLMATA